MPVLSTVVRVSATNFINVREISIRITSTIPGIPGHHPRNTLPVPFQRGSRQRALARLRGIRHWLFVQPDLSYPRFSTAVTYLYVSCVVYLPFARRPRACVRELASTRREEHITSVCVYIYLATGEPRQMEEIRKKEEDIG